MGTVVNHLAGTHGSTCFQIIDTYTVTTAGNIVSLHAIFAQGIDSRLADFMLRQLGYEISVMSIVGTADSHIGLTAAIHDIKRIGLHKTGIARSRQSQHDLTQCYDFLSHNLFILGLNCYFIILRFKL